MKITKTMAVTGRVEICSFASLVRAYETEGLHLRSKSDVVWQAIEQLVKLYSSKQGVEPFSDVREAVEYMSRIGLPLESNLQAIREIALAKVCQDAEEDYGVENLQTMVKRVSLTSMRKNSVEMPPKKMEWKSDEDLYREAADLMLQKGFSVPSFEEFMERKKRVAENSSEPVVQEQVQISEEEYKEKEEKRLAAEKAAYSPEALRSAMARPA